MTRGIHGFVTYPTSDQRGYFRIDRHCVVRIRLTGIRSIRDNRDRTAGDPVRPRAASGRGSQSMN